MLTSDRARDLLREGLSEPVTFPDGGSARVVILDDAVQIVWRDAEGAIAQIVEQPVDLLPLREVTEDRYQLLVGGIRCVLARAVGERAEILPAELVQPDLLLDPALVTAEDVARVALDPIALAGSVGPHQIGALLREHGLAAIPDATAARLHRFRSDDFEVARAAARELVREVDVAAIPALLVLLSAWIPFATDPVWFTRAGRNAHGVLATAVAGLLGEAGSPEDRRRVQALVDAGLIEEGKVPTATPR